MARMYVELPSRTTRASFLATVSEEARPLAEILLSGTGTAGSGGTGFIDFLLTSATENFQEKAQIVDTLTDNYVAFYSGEEPPLFQYSGVLLNTYQDDQRVWMFRLYKEILRGTRLASRNLIMKLRYDSFIVSGYMESLSMALSGETEHTASQFTFTMRVKSMTVLTPALGSPTLLEKYIAPLVKKGPYDLGVTTNQRAGITSPSVPTTATRGPAASSAEIVSNLSKLLNARKTLREAGRTDTEIDEAFKEADAASEGAEVDDRELQVTAAKAGTDRVAAAVKNILADLTNPFAASNDGAAGTTNVMGQLDPSIDPERLVKVTGGRARGARTV
jgi:hypothetical protein